MGKKCSSLSFPHPGIGHSYNPSISATCSTSTLQQWDDFSQFNKNRAEAEMKEAIELREAIALTIAEVTDHLPNPAPLRLMDGPSMHSSPYLLFPVDRVALHPHTCSIERHLQMALS